MFHVDPIVIKLVLNSFLTASVVYNTYIVFQSVVGVQFSIKLILNICVDEIKISQAFHGTK